MSSYVKDLKISTTDNPSSRNSIEGAQAVEIRKADETTKFVEEHGDGVEPPTPQELKKLNMKIYLRLILLLIAIDLMLFIDKATLGQAAILGIMDDAHLTDAIYNNLNTIFYTGYIVGQIPGQLLIQRLPLGKYVSSSIFIWAIIVFLHCVATSYGGLIPIRFLLGVFESALVPAMEMTMSMFFTPSELQEIQPIYWISCVGSSIPSGLIGYGLLWSKSSVSPWKFFMIITGGVTLFLSLLSWFVYPDNPAKANFLTIKERVQVIQRVHAATKSSIEQKTFKKSQFYETLRDPITWLFGLASFCLQLANNLAFQMSLLYLDLGVGELGSTLVTVASGGFSVLIAIIASVLLRFYPGYSAWWATFWVLPAIAGSIGMIVLSWDKTIALLACLLLGSTTWGMTYIIALTWAYSSSAGYTKKLTRNAMFMMFYGISNIISPQLWKSGGPRYYNTWIAQTVVSFVLTPAFLLIIRFILVRRNRGRKAWVDEQLASGNTGEGFIEQIDENGQVVKVKVDISLLDLTDLENKFFIYPL
ncbi:putative transporter PB1 [Talaromyces atroroseus]|uniref:Putative transporter PB1 n=1 Tax=Talaromyces atroroseus TaxID=1441469 RepID=A0A225B022_TALAT|nr:putative transporter PB1 [Talaromyces atroroseus]OKL60075.1 putative transporter PB1 [Talaromyces atroroseus]